jgi:Type IV secretion system pilin
MKQMLLQFSVALALLLTPALMQPTPAFAATCPGGDTAKGQVLKGIGQTGNNCDDSGVNTAVRAVVRILAMVAGIAAVIMIIISGFKYITSNGDSGKISSAKNTLIYALVGIFVAAIAQALVSFVLNQAGKVN